VVIAMLYTIVGIGIAKGNIIGHWVPFLVSL